MGDREREKGRKEGNGRRREGEVTKEEETKIRLIRGYLDSVYLI